MPTIQLVNISITVSGSTAVVCVETEGAASVKSLGMPQNSAIRKSVLVEAISCWSGQLNKANEGGREC